LEQPRNFVRARIADIREATGVQLISPIGLSLVALLPLAFSLMIPASVYQAIVHEDNLMQGDYRLIGFYLACVAAHVFGCLAVAKPVRKLRRSAVGEFRSEAWMMVAAPLMLALLLDVASLALLVGNNPGAAVAILTGHGGNVKNSLDTAGALGGAQPFLAAVVWWATMRYYTMRDALTPEGRSKVFWLICACVLVGTAVAVIKVARYELMPLYLGLIIIRLRQVGSGKSAWFFVSLGLVAVAFIVALFAIFSAIRGQDVIVNLIGYGPTSFNHLSALLSGRLQYVSSGNYTVGFLSQVPLLGRIIPDLPPPDSLLLFEKEFDLTRSAGLNGGLIWVTSWGYYFVDLGVGVFLFAFVLGLIAQATWNLFNRQSVVGLTIYPLMAVSIILWITSNFLTRKQTTVVLITALLLWIWERSIDWRSRGRARVSSVVEKSRARRI
jgi:hypothetical protein